MAISWPNLRHRSLCVRKGAARPYTIIKRSAIALLLIIPSWVFSAPFYVVDGQLGVAFEDIPPAEQILYTTVLDSAEAVFIYGERARDGAVIVQTKEYAKQQHYQTPKTSPSPPKSRSDRFRERMERRRNRKAIFLALTLIILGIEEIRKKRAEKKQEPMSDDDYRKVQEGNPVPLVPQSSGLDPLFAEAAMYVVGTRRAAIADLRRFFRIDYQHALRLIAQLEDNQVISKADRPDRHDILFDDFPDLDPLFQKLGITWNP